jgi:hypothetical protein
MASDHSRVGCDVGRDAFRGGPGGDGSTILLDSPPVSLFSGLQKNNRDCRNIIGIFYRRYVKSYW